MLSVRDTCTWPIGWVRCAWWKKLARCVSPNLILVKRKRGTALMHKQCAKDAELHDWANAPPAHGGD